MNLHWSTGAARGNGLAVSRLYDGSSMRATSKWCLRAETPIVNSALTSCSTNTSSTLPRAVLRPELRARGPGGLSNAATERDGPEGARERAAQTRVAGRRQAGPANGLAPRG